MGRNIVKLTLLLTTLTVLFGLVGQAIGGTSGIIIAAIFALVMNGGAYWFSDRLVLRRPVLARSKTTSSGGCKTWWHGWPRGHTCPFPSCTSSKALRRLSAREAENEQLTEREREILQLVAGGLENRAIAARLHLSEKTVGNRLSEIFQKLGVSNRTQAALVARERGILPTTQS